MFAIRPLKLYMCPEWFSPALHIHATRDATGTFICGLGGENRQSWVFTEYSCNTNSTCTAPWPQRHTCQVSRLHLERLQRYRANEILLTQQNKKTSPAKKLQPLYGGPQSTRHVSRTTFGLLTHMILVYVLSILILNIKYILCFNVPRCNYM